MLSLPLLSFQVPELQAGVVSGSHIDDLSLSSGTVPPEDHPQEPAQLGIPTWYPAAWDKHPPAHPAAALYSVNALPLVVGQTHPPPAPSPYFGI